MKLKKVISSVLAFAMAISIVPVATFAAETVNTTLYSDDFESYDLNKTPENITVKGDSDSVYVDTVGTSKRLWLKNDSDIKSLEIEKKFKQVSGKTVAVELDFLQLNSTSNGDTILGIYSGDTPVFLLETKDGNIVYKGSRAYTTVVEGYGFNREYKIKVMLDLFNSSAEIYVQGLLVGNYDLLDNSGTIDSMRIKSQSSPGFTVDNINIYMEENVSKVIVSGNETPVIPAYDAAEYEYTAKVTDSNGSEVSDVDIEWSLTGNPDNISLLNNTGKKAKISVKNNAAPEQSFGIKAKVKDSEISGTLSLTTKELSADSIEIIGWQDKAQYNSNDGEKIYIPYPSYRITGDDKEQKNYKFKTKVLDQFGNEVDNYGSFDWSIEPLSGETLPNCIKIDERTGVVTVTSEPKSEQKIIIKAKSNDNASLVGEAKLSLLTMDIYASDKARFDAVIAHVESVLDSAVYGNTPLLGDIFTRNERTPAYIPTRTKDLMASNVMAQSNLMRAMYTLTNVTGNEKYKDRVDEIYKYLMNNGLMENGVAMGWGGHMTMDMEEESVFLDGGALGTHEIKGIAPYLTPMFSETANKEYAEDTFNNGNGWAGFLSRAMFSGHFLGNFETLAFERHWTEFNNATKMESVWQTPEVFDSERRGPVQREGGAAFVSAGGNIMQVLLEYYESTGDENALSWAENFMQTQLNAALYYFVYKDPDGNFIWPSDTTGDVNKNGIVEDGDFKREFYNNKNELAYVSVKKDSVMMYGNEYQNVIYEHRDIAEYDPVTGEPLTVQAVCYDEDTDSDVTRETGYVLATDVKTGEEVKLTLYNVWTEGFFGEMATTRGGEWKYKALNESLETQFGEGAMWYQRGDLYTGPEYGDRLYNNMIWGTDDPTDKDTWLERGYVSEEEADLMIVPYSGTRENTILEAYGYVCVDVINLLAERGEVDKAAKYLEQYSRAVYNTYKQRYNFSQDWFDTYMFWIRPNYMRKNNIVKYEEVAWDENIHEKNKRYFATGSLGAPHIGYFYQNGGTFPSKRIELTYLGTTATTCAALRDMAEKLRETDPSDPDYEKNIKLAQTFENRCKYLWKALRDMCTDKVPIGDIGEDFMNLEPDLDMASTASNAGMVTILMHMYRATKHEDFLKLARRIADNWFESEYVANEQVFVTGGSQYIVASAPNNLALMLEFDALLLDRYSENIPYLASMRGYNFFDTSLYDKTGYYDYNNTYLGNPTTLYPNDSVKVKKVNILHDKIELKVGESIKIKYTVIPWDAGSKGVIWDVYDQRVAMMDTDTATLYALKKGKTKIRCVASSRTGIESKEVEVIVK